MVQKAGGGLGFRVKAAFSVGSLFCAITMTRFTSSNEAHVYVDVLGCQLCVVNCARNNVLGY